MSLVKRPVITPEKLAANQANARQSQGAAWPEGLQRIREARTIHGFYSKAPREAMRVLGENPLDFDRLLATLMEVWEPENGYETSLVRRLARVMWRLDRSDRVQEGMTVYQVELQERRIERNNREDAAEHKKKTEALERLLHAAGYTDFHPTGSHWRDFGQVYGEEFSGRAERIYLRMIQLQRPQDAEPDVKEEAPPPPPALLKEEEREPVRADLRSLLRQEIEAQNEEYRQQREQRAQEASAAFRDAYMAPTHPQAGLMLRAEDSAFRQLRQLHQMLTELKAGRTREPEEEAQNFDGYSHDVVENKGSVSEAGGNSHDVTENKGPISEGGGNSHDVIDGQGVDSSSHDVA